MTKRIVYYLIVLLLSGLLLGCNKPDDTNTSKGGTLYLNTNSVISLTYDNQGIVTAITAESENAKEIVENYQDFKNKTYSEVIVELVKKIGEAGHLQSETTIEITYDQDSVLLEKDFDKTIMQKIQTTLVENKWNGNVKVESPENDVDTSQSETEETAQIPEGAIEQPDGTFILTAYVDNQDNIIDVAENALFVCTYVYDADGHLISEFNKWRENELPRFYNEYYPDGNRKASKKWNGSGVLVEEFTSFHNENNKNGVHTEYNKETGELEFRTTEGNPDGSPATMEQWTKENGGEHIVEIYNTSYMTDPGAQVVEARYTLDSGAYHNHIYDYEKQTMHTIGYWPENNTKRDMITTLMTDLPIEGYHERTIDGVYMRDEWKNHKKTFSISDGGSYMGYKVKDTTYYYSNGTVKSFERYFYKDGGHYYVEYDENGNETFSEITTAYY